MITLSSNPYFACIAAMSVYTERCIHVAQYYEEVEIIT
jgi:hypothetical protein